MKHIKLTTLALASAFALSSTSALAATVHHRRASGPMTCTSDNQVIRTRSTAIQPPCQRADTCRTAGVPPRRAAIRGS
jgi:hypothetical protein